MPGSCPLRTKKAVAERLFSAATLRNHPSSNHASRRQTAAGIAFERLIRECVYMKQRNAHRLHFTVDTVLICRETDGWLPVRTGNDRLWNPLSGPNGLFRAWFQTVVVVKFRCFVLRNARR